MKNRELFNNQRIIRKYYPFTSNAEIGGMIGKSANYVCVMAFQMGLRKNADYLSGVRRKNGMKGLESMRKLSSVNA